MLHIANGQELLIDLANHFTAAVRADDIRQNARPQHASNNRVRKVTGLDINQGFVLRHAQLGTNIVHYVLLAGVGTSKRPNNINDDIGPR